MLQLNRSPSAQSAERHQPRQSWSLPALRAERGHPVLDLRTHARAHTQCEEVTTPVSLAGGVISELAAVCTSITCFFPAHF